MRKAIKRTGEASFADGLQVALRSGPAKGANADAPLKGSYATPALEKGLDVLELLAQEPAGLTKSEIARRLNRSVSEIFRMLHCLEERGYIAQHGLENRLRENHNSERLPIEKRGREERYTLTLRLFKLAQEHPPTERLITEALPVLHALAHTTVQSCHMGVLDGREVVILAQANAPLNVGIFVKLGSTIDLMESATAHVILAYQTPDVVERAVEEWKRERKVKVPADLQTHLEKIRKKGHEHRESYQLRGVTNLSYPVFDDRGFAIAAVTVPFIERMPESRSMDDVAELLRIASVEISHGIGGAGRANQAHLL